MWNIKMGEQRLPASRRRDEEKSCFLRQRLNVAAEKERLDAATQAFHFFLAVRGDCEDDLYLVSAVAA